MLQIRLNRVSSSEGTAGAKSLPVETVTVACPDHLVLADLPVAKSIGIASTVSSVKTVGRRSRRHLGERVHFCVRCDFPIAIYGRLSPCEHAFCLDCARSDSSCYLCDERIQKIQTIKMMEGIFICAAPHCLKSFLKRPNFESHIHESHVNLLQPKTEKEDGNELDAFSVAMPMSIDPHAKQSTPTDSSSTARGQLRTGFSPSSTSQPSDLEEKAHRLQSREQQSPKPPIMQPKPPPFYGRHPNYPEVQPGNPQADNGGPYNRFHHQQSYEAGSLQWRDSDQFSDKQQGTPSESPFPDYPSAHYSHTPPNFVTPVGSNQVLPPPGFGHPSFPNEGAQPFHNAHYEMARPDLATDGGSEQGSLLGYPMPPPVGMNFPDGYPQPWNMGSGGGMLFEQSPAGQGIPEGYANVSDHKDGKGVLAPQPATLPPPPPPPIPQVPHLKRGNFSHSGDAGWDGQGYGWQNEKPDRFGGGKD
ncbi:hypothetical protein Sjap_023372 [Stephania japonica]|uniref:RING-type E3 ubiquitin transferase n=1 Tax=Stephania japonica TaxID=461633 RepID=A0AAP0HP66_9MAGN